MGSNHFVRRDNHECNGSRSCNKLQTPGLEDCIKSISPPGEGGVQNSSSDDEGRECDESGERVNGKEQGDRVSRRQRFQTVLLEAIQTIFPTSLTELSNYFYSTKNLSVCLNKEYQTHAMEIMAMHKASVYNMTWEDILTKTPQAVFEKSTVLDIDESVQWIYKILAHNNINVKDFTNTLCAVMNRNFPKKNAIMLHGPPNAGKTLLGNSIANSALYSTTISQMSGKSSFEFADMSGQRCVLINEPKITDVTIEMFKNILEGQPVTIDVKYKAAQTLVRVPIILCSNQNLAYYTSSRSVNERAIEARVTKYTLKEMPELVDCKAQLHPLAWLHFIELL